MKIKETKLREIIQDSIKKVLNEKYYTYTETNELIENIE